MSQKHRVVKNNDPTTAERVSQAINPSTSFPTTTTNPHNNPTGAAPMPELNTKKQALITVTKSSPQPQTTTPTTATKNQTSSTNNSSQRKKQSPTAQTTTLASNSAPVVVNSKPHSVSSSNQSARAAAPVAAVVASTKLSPFPHNHYPQNGPLTASGIQLNPTTSTSTSTPNTTINININNPVVAIDETPNKIVYKKVETIIERMQEEGQSGVPIKTVKSFMSKIPSVFTGSDLVQWMLKRVDVEDACEALHFAHLIASHGYIFPIDDHILTVKNDGTFFRFQTPYYWPSNNNEPENTDYAVYLCRRTMQNKTRLELADYEAENLAKLQKLLSRKWEFIYMQAEAQIKVDKKRDKMERKILDSQERAFWDVYRPAPGCINTTEVDIRKTMRMRRTDPPNIGFFGTRLSSKANKLKKATAATNGGFPDAIGQTGPPASPSVQSKFSTEGAGGTVKQRVIPSTHEEHTTLENLKKEKDFLKRRLERRYVKTSKVQESYTNYYEQYIEFDPFITPPDPSNPWIADSTEFWDMERSLKDIPQRRVRRWGFSIHELLKDPSGLELFRRFLEREFSNENLRFYEVCDELRYASNRDILTRVNDIYNEFLAPGASSPINIDSRIMAITKNKIERPDRYTYDEAREHIFNLMTRDSYNRFLRSDTYRDSLASAKKKPKSLLHSGRLSIVRPILNS